MEIISLCVYDISTTHFEAKATLKRHGFKARLFVPNGSWSAAHLDGRQIGTVYLYELGLGDIDPKLKKAVMDAQAEGGEDCSIIEV